MEEAEFAKRARRAERPAVYHVLVLPHSPKGVGSLLSPDGKPIYTDYSAVDWSGLARSIKACLEDVVPKAVTVYVADDGPDILDISNLSIAQGREVFDRSSPGMRTYNAIKRLTMKEIRAGVIKLSRLSDELHINQPQLGKRPPLAGIVIGLKFTNSLQAVDYFSAATETLFDHFHMMNIMSDDGPSFEKGLKGGEMAPFIHDWLQTQFGAAYDRVCTVLSLGLTASE